MSDEDLFEFRLYVAGTTPRAMRALASLVALCDGRLPGAYGIEVVDVLIDARRADADGVRVTPLVVRTAPLPQCRYAGELSDVAEAAAALGLPETGWTSHHPPPT